jgi:hypothetical protein
MIRNNPNRRRAGGVGMAVSAALAAALIGLANAPAASADADLDPFQDLYGDIGINTWTPAADAALPIGTANSLDVSIEGVQAFGVAPPFLNIVGQLDPTSYAVETIGPDQYQYVPTDGLGDLANTLDYGLYLTGLSPELDPLILDTFQWTEGLILSPLLLLAGFLA